jgi:LPXTG-site transpeptidase (sortase) family protein
MTIQRVLRYMSVTLILLGAGLIAPLSYYWVQNKVAIASATALQVPGVAALPAQRAGVVYGHPKELVIPSLKLDLQVIDGDYDPKTAAWTLTTDKVQYAVPSTLPNNVSGNTLIYGHYRQGVFATLHTIQVGAEATVITDNGYKFTYTFESSEAVKPSDTSIFAYSGDPRLTLQTCSGSFYQNRQMHYFKFDKYERLSS